MSHPPINLSIINQQPRVISRTHGSVSGSAGLHRYILQPQQRYQYVLVYIWRICANMPQQPLVTHSSTDTCCKSMIIRYGFAHACVVVDHGGWLPLPFNYPTLTPCRLYWANQPRPHDAIQITFPRTVYTENGLWFVTLGGFRHWETPTETTNGRLLSEREEICFWENKHQWLLM